MNKLLILLAIVLGLCFSSAIANADITINEVAVSPADPTPESEMSFTVNISGLEEDDNVYFVFKECDGNTGLCQAPVNSSMTKLAVTNDYYIDISLDFTSATYLDYWFVLESNGTWTKIPEGINEKYARIDYNIEPENGDDTNGDTTNGGDNTPGFELITLFAAVFIGIILLRKKR